MGRYSNDTIAKVVCEAQGGGWKALDLSLLGIRDSDLEQLASETGVKRLASLRLSKCKQVTDAGLNALAGACPSLASLVLYRCDEITDAGVKALAAGCRSLESLRVFFCEKVTDAGVKALADGCTSLRLLDLSWCRKVTDAGVKALAEGCAGLESLILSWCVKVTDAGVKALAAGCAGLESLDLWGCEKVTLEGLARLADGSSAARKLRWLHLSRTNQLGLPEEVIDSRDAQRILAAVRDILAGAAEPLLEVKIVVLGDGMAGKTQLCNRLQGEAFQEDCDRTADFEVHELPLAEVGPEGEEIAARLFDFGGQPHLWSAHRFFLASQRNLYVVVIDGTRQGAKDLDYWLRYIRHYASQRDAPEGGPNGDGARTRANHLHRARKKMDIPVLAVVSKSDEAGFKDPAELSPAVLRAWPRLKVVSGYSSKTDDGLGDVLSNLRELVGGMDYVFAAKYPRALAKVKGWLEGDEQAREELAAPVFVRSMGVRQFGGICARAGGDGEARPAADDEYGLWLTVLRNLGVALWLGDLPRVGRGTPLAEQLYHPHWVKALTYGVIRHGLENELSPVIDDAALLELIGGVWRHVRENDRKGCTGTLDDGEKRQIVDLMNACRLIFNGIAGGRKHWLVLDWVADTRGVVEEMMPDESSRVTFDEFLPESFLVRFAGRWFNENSGLGDDLCRDQLTVVDPAYPKVKTVVRADLASRRLVIRALGGTPQEQTDVDGKVRGVIERLADEEGLAWREECWVQMEAKRTEGMEYHLHPPLFVIEPQTSFDDAWEVFCCDLLNLHEKTTSIRQRHAPEGGIDLLWQERGIAYQCKSVEGGRAGGFNVSKAAESIRAAIAHREETGWREYYICTNVALTGTKEKSLRKVLPDVKFLTQSFWIPRCREHHEHVYRRFRVLVPMKDQRRHPSN